MASDGPPSPIPLTKEAVLKDATTISPTDGGLLAQLSNNPFFTAVRLIDTLNEVQADKYN